MDRRDAAARLSGIAAAAAGFVAALSPAPALAAELGDGPSDRLGTGLLEGRVSENLLVPPPYGIETPDVYYPPWFAGLWSAVSVCTDVQAPCGPTLFGGESALTVAKGEVGPDGALRYRSRFVRGGGEVRPVVVADREYNVRDIARAAMGPNSVLDVTVTSPNKLSCLLSPAGAGRMMSVDLITLARRQEDNVNGSSREFHCAEVVRQIVANADGARPQATMAGPPRPGTRPPLLKEVETVCLYSAIDAKGVDGDITKIKCRQRSATFLLPSQQDPITYQMWQMSRGRPIDVRFYDVTYEKVT